MSEGKGFMTSEQKELLKSLYELGKLHTDSDVLEFCNEHNIFEFEVFGLIDSWSAPKVCKGCKHIHCGNTFPCNDCSRNKTDRFEPKS